MIHTERERVGGDDDGGGDYDEFLKRVGINLCGSSMYSTQKKEEKCEMRNRFLIWYCMLGNERVMADTLIYVFGFRYDV